MELQENSVIIDDRLDKSLLSVSANSADGIINLKEGGEGSASSAYSRGGSWDDEDF